jgi:hypothetical protein
VTYPAYLIDPPTLSVREVQSDDTSETNCKLLECENFQGVYLESGKGDMLYVDEDHKFNGALERFGGFKTSLFPGDVIFGRGLVVGVGSHGQGTRPKVSIEDVRESIQWLVSIPTE